MKLNYIYQGDCTEILKEFDDHSINVCLTDFPYGVGVEYNNKIKYQDTRPELKKLIEKTMPELLRVCKRVIITCGTHNIFLYPEPDWIMGWIFKSGKGNTKWGFSCWQPILCYGKDPYLENGMGSRSDIIIDNKTEFSKVNHPCPKPISTWRKILKRVSVSKDDIILDPFMGSGTTGIVAKQLNRNYIGIELNPDYVQMANKRIEKTDPIENKKIDLTKF